MLLVLVLLLLLPALLGWRGRPPKKRAAVWDQLVCQANKHVRCLARWLCEHQRACIEIERKTRVALDEEHSQLDVRALKVGVKQQR